MLPHKVNLLNGEPLPGGKRGPGGFASLMIFAAIFAASFGVGRLSLTEGASAALASIENLPVIRQMHLISSQDRRLIGEAEDRVNILLLGMGGEGHDGATLTDTIILLSVRPADNDVAMLSVPRDLVVPLGSAGWRKINNANAFGEIQTPGRGGDYTRTTLEEVFGLDIPYYVRIDFSGFKDIIDEVGGVDVVVDRDFTDRSYPTDSYGYQTVSFKAGLRHMDGDTALKFSRSRHGNNSEGSDFARGQRQQKVLAALKDKLMSFRTLRNPATVSNLLAELKASVATNMQIGELLRLAKMGRAVDGDDVIHRVLDDGPGSPLVSSIYNGAYVLMPRDDDWSGLRDAAQRLFEYTRAKEDERRETKAKSDAVGTVGTAAADNIIVVDDKIRVEVRNGSGIAGLAKIVAAKLAARGFIVAKYGNAENFGYAKTIIFDYAAGRKAAALEDLLAVLGLSPDIVAAPLPAAGSPLDFLIILGKDAIR